jgi:hypothetical protein
MRTIKWVLDTGFATCRHEGEIEVEDDATDDEIQEAVNDVIWNHLSLSWWDKAEGE